LTRPALSPEERRRGETYYRDAFGLQRQGRFDAALTPLKKAYVLDSTHADTRFRLAQCLEAQGLFDEARPHFIAARDNDALRFRADSRINQIIKEVAAEFPDCAVLFDAEKRLSEASPDGICGNEVFLEHVHFNFHGNYLFAANLLPLLDSIIGVNGVHPESLTESECKRRLAFTPWEALWIDREIYDRLSKPPFTNQEDNNWRAHALGAEIARLTVVASDSARSILAWYRNEASLQPTDWRICAQLGNYVLSTNGNAAEAEKALRTALEGSPLNEYVRFDLAISLERQKRINEAIDCYREAIRINPLYFEAYVNLTDDLMGCSRLDEAAAVIKRVLRVNPALTTAQERYAAVLLMQGKALTDTRLFTKNAVSRIAFAVYCTKEALRLEKAGRIQDALRCYERALTVCPQSYDAWMHYGLLLIKTGKTADGIKHVMEAVRIDSTKADAHFLMAGALADQGFFTDAEREYKRALSLDPAMTQALDGLHTMVAKRDSLAAAPKKF
jgi:tetratricopeptide (TPR) repeat protein